MKKLVYAVFAVFMVQLAFAQDPTAKNTLEKVSKKYDSYKTMEANFKVLIQPKSGNSGTETGKIYLNKPENKFRIDMQQQDIFGDNQSIWNVNKEVKEIQISPADDDNQAIGPSNLFTFYKSGFNYKSLGSKGSGKNKIQSIELTPQNKTSNYSKITLRINGNDHIQDVTILDKSGMKYTYSINALYVNQNIPGSTFQYQKRNYPNYEEVDLR
ncbi:LolA family protein [Sphingobacterium kyonggiense]